MDKNKIEASYQKWQQHAIKDDDLVRELKAMKNDEHWKEDAFYRELTFGTGGLRGVIGAGPNRVNIYTVAKASQGIVNDLLKQTTTKSDICIAVSYDSRIKSRLFAEIASGVFAANGIHVYIYDELMPTPCLSYAVRKLKCLAGIMVTASHNPAKYNGYKVYGADGCQITTAAADAILYEMMQIDFFKGVNQIPFTKGIEQGSIRYISKHIYASFIEEVKKQSLLNLAMQVNKNMKIIYTPLHGAGLKPILRTLYEEGYTNIIVVDEQKEPDGYFTTCPYPNPEIKEAMALGIEYAKRYEADLLLATDPDCDRIGIAVRTKLGEYVLLSGNETGVLLFDYICSQRTANKTMPMNPVCVKTIVTTDMAQNIANHYGVQMINVLTGFKFIGEQIGQLEKKGCVDSYIFGFEESYGYLSGHYARDKDAVNGALLICEMFAYYKMQGVDLLTRLNALYDTYGYCLNTLHSYDFEGIQGFEKIQKMMKKFRNLKDQFGNFRIHSCVDYLKGIHALPISDVIKIYLENNHSIVIRPSGTEPKLKVYFSVQAEERKKAEDIEIKLVNIFEKFLGLTTEQ